MKDPYSYTEKVAEMVGEAVTMETSSDTTDAASVGTTDDMIDGEQSVTFLSRKLFIFSKVLE